jgi:hypothetical protein
MGNSFLQIMVLLVACPGIKGNYFFPRIQADTSSINILNASLLAKWSLIMAVI